MRLAMSLEIESTVKISLHAVELIVLVYVLFIKISLLKHLFKVKLTMAFPALIEIHSLRFLVLCSID